MHSFRNDYSEGACEQIMERMLQHNRIQEVGYGLDDVCESARKRIKKAVGKDDIDVHFLVGGTQTNRTVINSALRPHEAVIAVESGHINVHETGAIEASGHKVVIGEGAMGKLTPQGIEQAVWMHTDEHMVKPKMVYISNATEIGTIYTRKELTEIRRVCDQYELYLFLDGARLGAALSSEENDVTLQDLGNLCDVFYIGGTKNGALFGEAVIIVNAHLKTDFRYAIKQNGGMLAKGFLLGIQFDELMKDNLLLTLAAHANQMAQKLQQAFIEAGCPLFVKSCTNQIFPVLPNDMRLRLEKQFDFMEWEKVDDTHSAVRLVTSWATPQEAVDKMIAEIKR